MKEKLCNSESENPTEREFVEMVLSSNETDSSPMFNLPSNETGAIQILNLPSREVESTSMLP